MSQRLFLQKYIINANYGKSKYTTEIIKFKELPLMIWVNIFNSFFLRI